MNKEIILDTISIARRIVDILEEHKAEDIVLMDVSQQVFFTDYFIICSGSSSRMLQSLSDVVMEIIRDEFHLHGRIQGITSGGWVLLDLGDIVVHLFSPDRREYYQLEDLWKEAKILVKLH
ncbi:MAG: ribosome silencing factor [Flexilinea sp.]